MKSFVSNFNATKKLSVTSVLFSLLILFFSLNGGFCTNFCSASNSDDNIIDDGYNNSDASRSENNQNNLVDVNAFVNASGKFDQFYEKNNNNEEEDVDENSIYKTNLIEEIEEEEEEKAYESSLFETRNPNKISRLTSTPYNKRPTLNLNKPSKQ